MDFVFMVHASEWIIFKVLELTRVVWAGYGCIACFPNWHVSQTSDITSYVPNLGRVPTRFYFFINLRCWRLTWPTRLCQIPMFPAPFPCVNNMQFTLSMFASKVNIHSFLSPFANQFALALHVWTNILRTRCRFQRGIMLPKSGNRWYNRLIE